MKSLTIGQRLSLGFGLLCSLCCGLGWLAIRQDLTLKEITASVVGHTLPHMTAIHRANLGLAENQLRMNHLLRTETVEEQRSLLEEARKATESNNEAIRTYEASIVDAADRRNYEEFKRCRQEFQAVRSNYIALVQTNRTQAAKVLDGAMDQAFHAYLKAGDLLVKYNNKDAEDSGSQLSAQVRHAIQVLVGAGLLLVVIGIGCAFLIRRSITRVLTRVSEVLYEGATQVTAAAGQVSQASQSLAERASEQAASLEQISSSLQETSSMTERQTKNSEAGNDLAREARMAAEKGVTGMAELHRDIDRIRAASDAIAAIIKTIDEIAFQTNILALNAAVEAARAGEAGMGFAVVADEVRGLAGRCAQSAKETSGKIQGTIAEIAQSVATSSRVSEQLATIVEKARRVEALAAGTIEASRQQNQGIGHINVAMTQLDDVTQANAASAEETASAAEELNAQASTLKDAVDDLQQLVTGSARDPRPEPTAFEKPLSPTQPITRRKSSGTATRLLRPQELPPRNPLVTERT